ncbi:MAG: ribonuclease P protein component [Bacteroidales bacterium]|jgi:ribonuclease P protein component|nr:ribonuclease P protein component [Bacteroidales bacterium]
MHNTFNKRERLCGKKKIDALFAQENSFFSYPFVVRWQLNTDEQAYPAQILIVVPKRKLRHAVDRNRTKRLIRECYRMQKHRLYTFLSDNSLNMCFSLSYIDTKTPEFHMLMEKTTTMIETLCQHVEKNIPPTPCSNS